MDMYAIIKTGGKQYKVEEGQMVKVEKLDVSEGESYQFDRVLAVSDENGEVEFGRPFLEDVEVKGTVIEQGKNKKIIVFKYKPKKRQKTKMGHRQPYTKVLINEIIQDGQEDSEEAEDTDEESIDEVNNNEK